ncbi:unnamed protein product [Pleuronectes platessa]|uniref:very-long-chain 3-oxoacyl-CoA synthase n=1 Tax=Pleuronectes platessa TaxID=8262 RepID=A0A9N7YJX5_PLEPL|nr:unnamed protein product [Pleuronectes platessa]
MYTYYAARAGGLRVPRPFAMIITATQILQMVMGLTVLGLVYYWMHEVRCPSNMDNVTWGSMMYLSYLILFAMFFYNSYLRGVSSGKGSKAENCSENRMIQDLETGAHRKDPAADPGQSLEEEESEEEEEAEGEAEEEEDDEEGGGGGGGGGGEGGSKPEVITMSLWMILPVSLPVFTITGIWLVYAMALYNQHVCPVHNWLYNESCEEPLQLQRDPVLCCTLENIPLISKCGTLPPESCFFSLICSTGSFMAMLIGLLRYAHVIERHQNCVLNMAGLSTGWICATGLIMVGNFQVDFAKVLHYVGAGSALTYRLAKTQDEYRVGHVRVGMALLALIALVLSSSSNIWSDLGLHICPGGVFFCQESFALQHASAIFEWLYCSLIMLFYGTFAFEFGGVSGDTLMVLSRGAGVQSFSEHKAEGGGGGQPPSAGEFIHPITGLWRVSAPPGGCRDRLWSRDTLSKLR